MQWHPLFAYLLRLLIGEFYQVEVEEPVSDLPRRADVVLLRRTTTAPAPFAGLWSHLRPWNVVEFKGPTDAAVEGDGTDGQPRSPRLDRLAQGGRERRRQAHD